MSVNIECEQRAQFIILEPYKLHCCVRGLCSFLYSRLTAVVVYSILLIIERTNTVLRLISYATQHTLHEVQSIVFPSESTKTDTEAPVLDVQKRSSCFCFLFFVVEYYDDV